jgi:hypothetical protein
MLAITPNFKQDTLNTQRCPVFLMVSLKLKALDIVAILHPVATGPAAEIVAAHQLPQTLEFYSGYTLTELLLIIGGSVLLLSVYGLSLRRGSFHINTRKSIHTKRMYANRVRISLIIAVIPRNKS